MDSVDEDHHRSPKDEEQVTVPEPASKNGAGEDHHVEPKASNRCLVYCRLRPSNKRDFVAAGSSPLITVSGNCAVVKDERRYNFDGTFGVESSQEEIFHSVAIPCIDHAFRGCRSALMCYGQTGTGKTYTLCSTKEGQEGIIPRAAKYIFDEIIAKHPERRYVVEAQFVQIYRDKLNDLLQTPEKAAADRLIPSKALDIRCDDVDGVTLTGVQSQVLTSSEEMVKLFHTGNARRVVGTTAMNAESSRGHSALIVWISNEDPSNLRAGRTMGKLTIIDLAGYERFSKTGITTDNTIQKDEAKTINASLLALGHVVSALSSGSRHIPWRDSKLTRLLQDSVGGRSRTSIILTVGPSSEHFHETANTLQFGMRSMCVKVETRVAVSVDYVELSRILEGEVTKRDALIDTLRAENREHVEQQRLVDQRYFEDRQRLQDTIEEERKRVVSAGGNEEQLKKLTEVLEVEAENLKEQQCEEISYQEEAFSQRVVRTIEVDRFRTERDIAQYKILYEKNMEDLKKKLDATRGARTNEDLLRALQTIAEKDVIIAARATETASLHEVIAQLADQLESHGVAPALNVDLLARNFMDVSQVEEIQQQLRDENEDLRAKLVDLRAQLDRMTSIANHRKDEINNLHKMLQQLRSSGVAVPEVESESRGATDLVGREEVELMRLSMQARLDDVAMECSRLREELKTRVRAEEVPMTARRMHVPGSVEATPRREVSLAFGMTPRGPFTARRTNANTTSTSAVVGVESLRHSYESIIEQLRHEVATLRTAAMKGGAATSNGAAATTTTAVREGSPAPSLPVPPLMLRQWGSTARDILEEDGDHLHGAVESGAAHNNVDFVVGVKEAEVEAVVKAMLLQEQQIANDRAVLQYSGELIKILRLQLRMAQLVPDAPQSAAPPPFLGLSQRTYTALLDKLRQENRKLAGRLLLPTSASSEDVMTMEKVLADRDAAISAKDAALLEMSATNEYVSKIASRLLGQLQNLKITPCVAVPDAIQDQCGPASSEAIAELEADLQQERDSNERLDVQLRMLRQERERIAYGVRLQQEDQVSQTMARMGCEITDLNEKLANQDAEIRRLQKENDELRAAKGWGPMQFFLGGTSPSKKKADSPTTTTPVTSGRYRDPSTSVEREDWPNSALHY